MWKWKNSLHVLYSRKICLCILYSIMMKKKIENRLLTKMKREKLLVYDTEKEEVNLTSSSCMKVFVNTKMKEKKRRNESWEQLFLLNVKLKKETIFEKKKNRKFSEKRATKRNHIFLVFVCCFFLKKIICVCCIVFDLLMICCCCCCCLSTLATDTTSQLNVLWHDGHTLGMNGA